MNESDVMTSLFAFFGFISFILFLFAEDTLKRIIGLMVAVLFLGYAYFSVKREYSILVKQVEIGKHTDE